LWKHSRRMPCLVLRHINFPIMLMLAASIWILLISSLTFFYKKKDLENHIFILSPQNTGENFTLDIIYDKREKLTSSSELFWRSSWYGSLASLPKDKSSDSWSAFPDADNKWLPLSEALLWVSLLYEISVFFSLTWGGLAALLTVPVVCDPPMLKSHPAFLKGFPWPLQIKPVH